MSDTVPQTLGDLMLESLALKATLAAATAAATAAQANDAVLGKALAITGPTWIQDSTGVFIVFLPDGSMGYHTLYPKDASTPIPAPPVVVPPVTEPPPTEPAPPA